MVLHLVFLQQALGPIAFGVNIVVSGLDVFLLDVLGEQGGLNLLHDPVGF